MSTKVYVGNANIEYFEATIAESGTEPSAGIDLGSKTLCGVVLPSGFDGSTLTFKMSDELAGTYVACTNTTPSGIAASRYVDVIPSEFSGVKYIKPVVGTQTGEITLLLAARGM